MNMEKSLITGDQLAKAVEKIFLLDRFVQWTGERKPEMFRFVDASGFNGDNLRIQKKNGYYVVPVGSWIVRAPDGSVHAFGEGVRFVPREMEELQEKLDGINIPIHVEEEKPITTYIPEDPYETEVVEEGNAISLRRKLDKDGEPILKKNRALSNGYDHGWMEKFAEEAGRWTENQSQ